MSFGDPGREKSPGGALAGVFDGLVQAGTEQRQWRQLREVLADADGLGIQFQQLCLRLQFSQRC